jgi:hypothetical protein
LNQAKLQIMQQQIAAQQAVASATAEADIAPEMAVEPFEGGCSYAGCMV